MTTKTKTKTKATLLDQISSLCDDESSFRARLSTNTFYGTSSSKTVEKAILLFEYIQIISPILLVSITLDFKPNSALFQAALFVARFINPSYWMSFDKSGTLENLILIIICASSFTKLLVLIYILYICKKALEANRFILNLWKGVMKFQTRIIYFYVTTFYVSAIKVNNWDTFATKNNQTEAFEIVMIILISFETFLALVPKIRFHNILPTKSFISAKENTLEIVTLLQKIVILIFSAQLDFTLRSSYWIFLAVNLCFDAFRLTNFYIRLPLYSFEASLFQGWFLATVASLNLASFVSLVAKTIDEDSNTIVWILVLWAILLILGIKLSNNILKRTLWRLVCDPTLKTPHLLVHRIVAIKELRRLIRATSENDEKCDYYFLMNKTLSSHLENILWADPSNSDLNTKKSTILVFKNYLDKLQEKFPKDEFIQLYFAEFFFKRIKFLSDPIRICLNLRKNGSAQMRPNAEQLLIRIQKHVSSYFNPNLDINSFLYQQAYVAKLKQEMQKQTNLQIKICSEIMKDNPNLEHIYSNSQKAHLQRQIAIKRIKHMSTALNDFNMEPLFTAARYQLSVNHSLHDCFSLTKLYSQKHLKYQKYFSQESFCQENAFQDSMGFLVMTGVKGKEGDVIAGTKAVEKILGGDLLKDHIGTSFVERTPPIFQPIYSMVWRTIPEAPESTYMGKFNRCLMYHVDGYLIELEYFIHVHPFATQGFKFVFIMRPVVSEREFILLNENGDIDSASKILIERLDLRPRKTSIRTINQELGKVNVAFNMIAFPEKYEAGMHHNSSPANLKGVLQRAEAEEIYAKYTTEGMNIVLSNVDGRISYSYHCKVENLAIGSLLIKTLTLIENKRENKERTNERLSPINHHQKRFETFGNQDSPSFHTEDEKEEGWIDFDFDIRPSKKTPSENIQTDREMLATQREDTQRPLITQYQNTSTLKITAEYPNKHFSDSTHERPADSADHKATKIPQSSKNSGKLSQQQKRISSAFQAALDAHYYSKAFRGLIALFYMTLTALIITKIVVKVATDRDMNTLVAKKEIFSQNSFRSFYLIETSGLTRYVWQFYSGVLNLADYGPVYAADFILSEHFIYNNIMNLRDLNRAISQASTILDEETYYKLYQSDVKIYSTYFDDPVQSFTAMDSFQAVDQIVEAALYLYYGFFEQSSPTPEMTTRAKFLFRNALNDLIIKSAQISFAMIGAFNQQFQLVQNISLSFSVVFAVLFGSFSIVFCIFLCKQYSSDIFYISAICRLNHTRIQAIHKEFLSFQKSLQGDESNSTSIQALVKSQYLKNAKSIEDSSINHVKREPMKVAETKDLLKRSMFYMIGIIVAVFIPVILTISDQISGYHILQKIKTSQERLFFINMIRVTTGMASTSFRELAATNNTAYAENLLVFDNLKASTAQLAALRVGIYSEIMTEDVMEEYPELRTLLLGDGCTLLNTTFDYYCGILQARGKQRGLIYLMNEFENYLIGKMQDYKDSNKTTAALKEFATKDYEIISVTYTISLYEIDYMWDRIDQQFHKNVEKDQERRRNSSIGVFISVIFAGVIGWIYVLKGMGESVSRIKNILRVFPADLVLNSFLLKNFLMKTSNGVLDQIKNEI